MAKGIAWTWLDLRVVVATNQPAVGHYRAEQGTAQRRGEPFMVSKATSIFEQIGWLSGASNPTKTLMVSSLADRFSRLVTCLGGPPTDVNEIEWATDVPSGKALMEWATGQMAGGPHDPIASASLRRIALEEEEVRM